MFSSQFLNKVLVALVSIFSMSCSVAEECKKEVFVCSSTEPELVALKLCAGINDFHLAELVTEGYSFDASSQPDAFIKSSYHRAMVDEHSVEFKLDNIKVIVSDYHSEELDDVTGELSVTLLEGEKKRYFECDADSFSHLPDYANTTQ
ncbi:MULTISPECIES: hypothetical protein [unclassified Agarivorans]|uniref:hypothetical protein n=1 Tax=unclassified Agarivorans TaxID=2636026 RepID=UPI0026E3FAA7|nr:MULTISPECIES: hypothetical protein [unclassified Agarivorans]MDO6685486.1 hypothetical protein [Agarivorans sp. 3_MG-2023]MDO6715872.1 hypothetical protein [Agarivorans sp. 2_MG-2023]